MDITLEEFLESLNITFDIQPVVAFVGDAVSFEGKLTSYGNPLVKREIDILLNGSRYVSTQTNANGHYQGKLQVPYSYVSELELQALYYPQGEDVDLYLASLSPVRKLKVLFYETKLEIALDDKAYPGLETIVTGRFDYGQSTPLNEREIEIYFDDALISEVTAQKSFAQKIRIDPKAYVGKHVITVSSSAVWRYSPVAESAFLDVTRAIPILDVRIPKVAMIPWSVGIEGKLYSEVGPVSGAAIEMDLSNSQAELVSSEDGAFDVNIKMGMGFGLIGSQELVVQVLPQEPWHDPLVTSRSIIIVNVINCGGILVILVLLGIYLPGRLRKRLGAYPRRAAMPVIIKDQPQPDPIYSDRVTVLTSTEERNEGTGEPRNRIFYWYRFVFKVIQGITKALLKPHQTLREFANENSRVLGPAAKYFIALTQMVERLLYSQYRPTDDDVVKGKQLSQTIEEEIKSGGVIGKE
ncbi:DUF4129 domain-containing protein [Chloroflexota bacterium]